MEEITKILKKLMSFKTIDGRSLEFDKLFEYIKSVNVKVKTVLPQII